MRHFLLHHALPVFGIFLLAALVGVLVTPANPVSMMMAHWGCFAVGLAAYVLGVNIGRQTDPLRPRYLRLRVPPARETAHIICLSLLSAAAAMGPVAWLTREGRSELASSTGFDALQRTFLNGYWGPITLGLVAVCWCTRGKQRAPASDD